MAANMPENLAPAFGTQVQFAFVNVKIKHIKRAQVPDD
jgi:hypothetical protein